MLAANHKQHILEPNVLFLEDKPPMIVKGRKSYRRKKSTKIGINKKSITKTRKTVANIEVKKESTLNKGDEEEKMENIDPNDPLLTPQIGVKCELREDKYDHDINDEDSAKVYFDSDNDEDFCVEKYETSDEDDNLINDDSEYEVAENENEEDNEDDEPLILLTQTSASKKYIKKKRTPRLYNCLETCKHKCTTKYTKQQRIEMFECYWQLDKEDKVNFLRQHIRKPIITRIRNQKCSKNCCYFLTEVTRVVSAGKDNNDDLTKVCRKFFEGTLGISSQAIKEAIEGYELQQERIVRPLRNKPKENENKLSNNGAEKSKITEQFLDPETGNLTDVKPKKRKKRRKPGDPIPERFPRPINCAIRCIFKCHQNFSEEERKQICDSFWSLDFKRRKDFVLARIETTDVKSHINPELRKTDRTTRSFQTKFFLRSGINSENKRVCKHFLMNTLVINRFFIENAIKFADKTTGSYMGADKRGSHTPHNKLPEERKQVVKDHINSYPCWLPNKNSKTKYLHHDLSIKKMYSAYKQKCLAEQIKYVSTRIFYKVFHEDFRLLFLTSTHPKKGFGGFLLSNPHISHYSGKEVGGYWVDSKGNKLDMKSYNQNVSTCPNNLISNIWGDTSVNPSHRTINIVNTTSSMPLELVINPSTSTINMVKSYINPVLSDKFSHDSENM